MTPAINLAKKHNIPHRVHEYQHEPNSDSYGLEAVQKLGVDAAKVFKTLVISTDQKQPVVAIIPVSSMLSMKMIAKAAGAKKATLALPADVERSTGYVLGGVSPLGQKKRLKTYIDRSAQDHERIFVSAGRRGLEIELSLSDLTALLNATLTELCPT